MTTTATDPQAPAETPVWTVTPSEWAATRTKIEKITTRAQKRGFTGGFTITGEYDTVTRTVDGFSFTEQVVRVTLTGEAPCYEGWRLVAALDYDPHAGLVTRQAPGATDMIDRDQLRVHWCDHCQTERNRRRGYLVEHVEDGRRVQVGSTCLKDFLGWDGRIVWLDAKNVTDEVDGLFAGVPSDPSIGVDTALAVAYAATVEFGFVPTSAYDRTPTRDVVMSVLYPTGRADEELGDRLLPVADQAGEKVAAIREWIADGDRFPADSEYAVNLKAVAGAEFMMPRNLGLLASAPNVYARTVEREATRKADAESVTDCPAGRVQIEGEVVSVRAVSNPYAPYRDSTLKALVKVTTTGGVFKVWGTLPAAIDEADRGDRVRFTATVEPKDGETGFGFFKRPTKAEMVAKA